MKIIDRIMEELQKEGKQITMDNILHKVKNLSYEDKLRYDKEFCHEYDNIKTYDSDQEIELYKDEYTTYILKVYKGDEIYETEDLVSILSENEWHRIKENIKNKHKETIYID